jgi:hypothetical protein
MTLNKFIKPIAVVGNTVKFRNATVSDADFIFYLRSNPSKNKFLSKSVETIRDQELWLHNYSLDSNQIYFIIEDKNNSPCGTIRMYNQISDSFCWGSWITMDNTSSKLAIESMLMIYSFGLSLGFKNSHFDVRKENVSVCDLHKKTGALLVKSDALNNYYNLNYNQIVNFIKKFNKILPNGICTIY